MKNILIIALAILIGLPATGLAQALDSIQKVQNPCPAGTTLVYANTGTAISESAIGTSKTTYYKAWKWMDCKTGQLFDQPRKHFTQTDSSFYQFVEKSDTMICLLIREKVDSVEVECEVQKDILIRQDKQRKAWAKNALTGVVTIDLAANFKGGVGFSTYNYFARREDKTKPWKENILKVDGYFFALMSRRELPPVLTTCDCLDVIKEQKINAFTFVPGARIRFGNENAVVQPFVGGEIPLTVQKGSKPEVLPTAKAGVVLGFNDGVFGDFADNGGLQTTISGTYNRNGFGGEIMLAYNIPVMNQEKSAQATALSDAGEWITNTAVKAWEKGIVPSAKWTAKKFKKLFTKNKKEEPAPPTIPSSIWG